ncbi:hypothetical protein ACH6EH_02550 [Paenibacillus sp. JSM ZJ436]|uniref:hypothetical protein n=1 Tax=Paenibacillus sp. JSM ZJ436 TaxID=3376190 RepID=UPI0037907135
MKTKFLFILFNSLFIFLLLVSCSPDKDQTELDLLIDAMHDSSLKLEKNHPSIETTHFAYNSDENTFYLGLTFKDGKVPSLDQLKAIFDEYLFKAAEVTNENDWKIAFENYAINFEQLLTDNKTKLLAIKKINSEEIELQSN